MPPREIDYCVSSLAGNISSLNGSITIVKRLNESLQYTPHFIPNLYTTYIAALELPDNFEFGFTEECKNKLETIFHKTGGPFDLRLCFRFIDSNAIVSSRGIFESFDYEGKLEEEEETEVKLYIERNSRIHGFVLWINTTYDPIISLDNTQATAFLPIYFPVFPEGETVEAGDIIEFTAKRIVSADGFRPDYILKGLISGNMPTRFFKYYSPAKSKNFGDNAFYAKLINDQAKISSISQLNEKDIISFGKEHLPGYMLPQHYRRVNRIPLSINGKVDYARLRKLWNDERGISKLDTTDTIEITLIQLWRKILGHVDFDLDDHFFEVGGDSIKLVKFFDLARQSFPELDNITYLFEAYSVRKLASLIKDKVKEQEPAV